MQPKSLAWTQIRDALAQRIESGQFSPGDRLPSEPELSLMFHAGRHSVRRALSALSSEGRLRIEHGRGTFVSDGLAFQYTIDRRERLFDQLKSAGHLGEVTALASGEDPANAEVASALGLDERSTVHVNDVLLLVDDVPLGIGRSFHPLARFPDYEIHRQFALTQRMFYKSYGIHDFFREDTLLTSRTARVEEADLLKQQPEMPIVETKTRDVDSSGAVIGYSTTVWAASRIRFVIPSRT
ncbi:MAG: GntR family transcriptional regulator [Ilumatobacteraceae bacterium]|nr:GntR family transcriptional regulator [Ilumatobacteraceae bacterium]